MTFHKTDRVVLLRTVSPRVLERALERAFDKTVEGSVHQLRSEATLYTATLTSPALWLSLLARMQAWVSLIFKRIGGMDICASALQQGDTSPLNRRAVRIGKHKTPAAHASYVLGQILMRRYGLKRFRQWLYKFGLIGRLRFCFVTKRSLLWARRKAVSEGGFYVTVTPIFAAALHPD